MPSVLNRGVRDVLVVCCDMLTVPRGCRGHRPTRPCGLHGARLSYTFTGRAEEAAGRPPTVVEFTISPFGDEAVKLQVLHTGFTDDAQGEQDRSDVGEGWPAILAALKTLLETDRPLAAPGHFAPRIPARS
ncbi:SRPBCC domain-containing protein [Pseudonocardia sp. C8]|uniref:SRPBCC domain-containing protein n=1 Tax=Pseudonocardia sp. C8 TaxID=2762759 RepID=UPI001642DD1D|nr:SRPBCC domain-containing protein [Pseudonocardia sp. C8]MBC3194736.1 SRPBCC domain-containing protein [Pseudonocardia sp. C8]